MGKLVVSSFSLPGPAITQGPPVVAEPVLEAHRTDSLATPTVVVNNINFSETHFSSSIFKLKAVNGDWSRWSSYGRCSKECGGGKQTKTR